MIVQYHHEGCGTSRRVLHILRSAGLDPVVIDYSREGWTRSHLLGLFAAADLRPREALRVKGGRAEALGLTAPDVEDETILAAMTDDPMLVERPFVCAPKGTRLCRPAPRVLDLMDRLPPGPFEMEDGTPLIGEDGARLA